MKNSDRNLITRQFWRLVLVSIFRITTTFTFFQTSGFRFLETDRIKWNKNIKSGNSLYICCAYTILTVSSKHKSLKLFYVKNCTQCYSRYTSFRSRDLIQLLLQRDVFDLTEYPKFKQNHSEDKSSIEKELSIQSSSSCSAIWSGRLLSNIFHS